MDWNKIIKNRSVAKVRELDSKNNGDKLATMNDFIKWARKGTGERTTAVNYGDYTEVSVRKEVVEKGIKGRGWCLVKFYNDGDILSYEY